MKDKFELIVNLDYKMKSIYKKYFVNEGYEIVVEEDNLIFVKKNNGSKREFIHEKEVINFIINMAKKENFKGLIKINLDKEMNSILEKVGNLEKIDFTEKMISWQIRQAFLKAILEKKEMISKEMGEEF